MRNHSSFQDTPKQYTLYGRMYQNNGKFRVQMLKEVPKTTDNQQLIFAHFGNHRRNIKFYVYLDGITKETEGVIDAMEKLAQKVMDYWLSA